MRRSRSKVVVVAAVVAAMLAGQVWASADEVQKIDGDIVSNGQDLAYSDSKNDLACSARGSAATGRAEIKRTGDGDVHFAAGELVTVTGSATHAGITVTGTTVTIPSPWTDSKEFKEFNFVTTVLASVPNGSYTVTLTAQGPSGTATGNFPVSVSCPVTDTTAPVLVPTVTGTRGDDGWYTTNVTVAWTVTDGESAPTVVSGCATAAAPDTFTAETTAAYSTCSATSAGGSASESVLVKIDKTAPTGVSLSSAGTRGAGDWFTDDVTVSTSGTDAVSGVVCTPPQPQPTETAGTTFNGSCRNGAGLTTSASPVVVKLDKTGPSAQLDVTAGTGGLNGWYTSDVTVTASGSDSISGPVTCNPASVPLTTDTAGTSVTTTCTNAAGLQTAATPLVVKVDKSDPTTNVSIGSSAVLGANGWYTSDVVVSTNGADNVSEPLACSPDQRFTTDGEFTVNGTCTNEAGRSSAAAPLALKVDTTPPTGVALVVVGAPRRGTDGWYTEDVTVRTEGADPTSGVTCRADQPVSEETAGITLNGWCTNGAGLVTHAVPMTVKLDKTGPSAGLAVTAGQPGLGGWYTSDVTITTTGDDGISGGVVCTPPQPQTAETAGAVFNGSCTNAAGLVTNAAPLTVKLDKTGPTADLSVTAGSVGSNGWHTSDVAVTTSGTDSISAPVTCSLPQSQTAETAGAVFNGSCTNAAGLVTHAVPLTVKLDKTAPTSIAITGGPVDGGTYVFGTTPAAPTVCTADGGTSGLDTCVLSGYSDSVGTHDLVATATDNAGNVAIITRTYTVSPWTLTGFYSPVDMGGSVEDAAGTTTTKKVVNTVRGGSTVPVRFEIFQGSTEITDVAKVSMTVSSISCTTGVTEDAIEATTTGPTSLRHDGNHFQYNWQSPKLAGKCYEVVATAADGSKLTADFKLK